MQAMYFRFPPPAHSGKIVLTVEHAGKAFGKSAFLVMQGLLSPKAKKLDWWDETEKAKAP
jgi:hypothetical protein